MDIASSLPSTNCSGFVADGMDITADGKSAVGMVWNQCTVQGFRWTDTGGKGTAQLLQSIGVTAQPGKPPSNRPLKISDDGSMIGGSAANFPNGRVPAAWRADGTGFLLDPANTGPGEVLAISADGSILGGYLVADKVADAFSWTKAGGIVKLPRLSSTPAPTYTGYVNSIVAGGKLMFGRYGNPTNPPDATAVVWSSDGQVRALYDVITNAGIDVSPDYTLWNVIAASADGSVVVGIASSPTNSYVPWILTMPASAYAK
jgi:hypothetical protein